MTQKEFLSQVEQLLSKYPKSKWELKAWENAYFKDQLVGLGDCDELLLKSEEILKIIQNILKRDLTKFLSKESCVQKNGSIRFVIKYGYGEDNPCYEIETRDFKLKS